jgi:hypothetical protein
MPEPHSRHRCDEELFAWIPEPLAPIASKLAVSGASVRARELGLARLDATTWWGLPYSVDASLWRVQAVEPTQLAPFEDQAQHCAHAIVPGREQRHVLRRFTIHGPVPEWTPEVAQRFAAATLSRLRLALLRALTDAWFVVEGISAQDDRSPTARSADDRAIEVVGSLLALWRQVSHEGGSADLHTFARTAAYAAAIARELSARMYGEALASTAPAIMGESFLEARRWQARELFDLLFVPRGSRVPDDVVAAPPISDRDTSAEPSASVEPRTLQALSEAWAERLGGVSR